jgi:hypothetical protein
MDDYQQLIRKIQKNTKLVEILRQLFDIELLDQTGFEDWIILEGKEEHQVFAQDGSGGLFAMCGRRIAKVAV